jgi:hypothetical protein
VQLRAHHRKDKITLQNMINKPILSDVRVSHPSSLRESPAMTPPRQLLRDAAQVVDLFLTATHNDDFVLIADASLSELCEREGAAHAAAAMAALCDLTLLTWSETSGVPPQRLLDQLRRRINGEEPPPTLVPA